MRLNVRFHFFVVLLLDHNNKRLVTCIWKAAPFQSVQAELIPCSGSEGCVCVSVCEVVETFKIDRDALSKQLCLFLCRCCQGNKDRTCSNLSADQQLEAFPGQALPLLFLLCSMYEHTWAEWLLPGCLSVSPVPSGGLVPSRQQCWRIDMKT